ncbi:MAG: GtrA family protein [Eubacterium sp.]|nr:GtrA family protein [Eubacterium sp.]
MDLSEIKKKELLRFLVGGGSAVIADYLLYQLFLSAGISVSVAKAGSFCCGATVGFIINKLWTFESHNFDSREIGKYVMLYAVSACANAIVNKAVLFVTGIGLFAFLCATGTSTVMNFLGQKFFVFRRTDK